MPANIGTVWRAAGWLALGYSLLIAGFLLWGAFRDSDGTVLLMALLVIPWMAAPVVAAGACSGASPTRFGAVIFLALEAGLILSVAWVVADFTYIHPSSMGGVALLFWPLIQWIAVGVFFLLALLFGWRMRPDFLRDEQPVTPPPRA